ncbi:MAG: hypothetical protein HDT28_00225 [Clostridiales bacterium]|nr:hypothetical protein [Clostridiales bacterium]
MDIGRNDPCPCGSGKKYRYCCEQKTDSEVRLVQLYSRIKARHKPYLFLLDETLTLFDQAMDFSIASNALSLIKSILFLNDASATSALCLRNVMESRALIAMRDAGGIDRDKLELFNYQPALIEYDVYYGDKSLVATGCLDNEQLEKNYKQAARKFLPFVGNDYGKLEKLSRTYLPFLCDKSVTFQKIIKQYLGEQSAAYNYLTRIVHPKSIKEISKERLDEIQTETLNYLTARYGNFPIEQNDIAPAAQDVETHIREADELEQLQDKFQNIVNELRGLPQSSMSESVDIFNEIALALFDIHFDHAVGLGEIVLSKFRVIAEYIAESYKVLDGSNEAPSYTKLVKDYFSEVLDGVGMREVDTGNTIAYNANDYFTLLYRVSSSVSHGNGYLWFRHLEAGRYQDDVIGFIDRAVKTLSIRLRDIFNKHGDTRTADLYDKAYIMLKVLDS